MSRKGRTWRMKQRKKICVTDERKYETIRVKKLVTLNCKNRDNFILMWCWMRSRGFETRRCNLTPAEFPDTGRGLLATKSIEQDSVFISIPGELLITTDTVIKSYLGASIASWIPKLTPVQCLCVFLMCERARGSQSPWQPYLQFLPETYTNATYWNEQELLYLPVSCYIKAHEQLDKLEKSYKVVSDFFKQLILRFPEFEFICDKQTYQWAWSTINTRCVYMKQHHSPFLSEEDEDHYALAPMLDLLNHSMSAQVEASFNIKSQCYEIQTQIPYCCDDQVFISYGPHDNMTLLVEYGFLIPDNPHDVYLFDLGDLQDLCQNSNVTNSTSKLVLLAEQGMHIGLFCSKEGLSWKLATALRLLALDPVLLKGGWQRALRGIVSEESEEEMKRYARTLLQKALGSIPQNEENDFSSVHQRMASSLCKQQTDILLHCLDMVT